MLFSKIESAKSVLDTTECVLDFISLGTIWFPCWEPGIRTNELGLKCKIESAIIELELFFWVRPRKKGNYN